MEKDLNVSRLLDVYGNLLSVRQRELLKSYYDYDLSLSEIAENCEVTRQAVMDGIKKGVRSLEKYENELGILNKIGRLSNLDASLSKEEILVRVREIINE